MEELIDYSGKFDPEFSYDKFNKDMLLKLLNAYSNYLLRVDGYWYLTVKDKWGNEAALDCDLKVWEKAQIYELKTTTRLFNIQGNDVLTVMKAMQASPWMWIYEYDMDIKNNNHGILTINKCPTLLSLEAEGTGREKPLCQELEPKLMNIIAHYFNPAITVTALSLPPRPNKQGICCQWEFKL